MTRKLVVVLDDLFRHLKDLSVLETGVGGRLSNLLPCKIKDLLELSLRSQVVLFSPRESFVNRSYLWC